MGRGGSEEREGGREGGRGEEGREGGREGRVGEGRGGEGSGGDGRGSEGTGREGRRGEERGGEGRGGEGPERSSGSLPPMYSMIMYSRSVKFSGITSPIRPPTLRNNTSSNVER